MDEKTRLIIKFCNELENYQGNLGDAALKYLFKVCANTIREYESDLGKQMKEADENWCKAGALEKKLENIIKKYNLPETSEIEEE